jgi:hypothetical protein
VNSRAVEDEAPKAADARPLEQPQFSVEELRAKAEELRIESLYRDPALALFKDLAEQGRILRATARDRLDAFKWIAAISTAAFFLVGQTVGKEDGLVLASSVRGLLIAELGFMLSVAGAGAYMFVIDSRMAWWARRISSFNGLANAYIRQMDASGQDMRDALERAEGPDIVRANTAWHEWTEKNAALTAHIEDEPGGPPEEGRTGALLSTICVGGLGLGIAAVAAHWLSRLTW